LALSQRNLLTLLDNLLRGEVIKLAARYMNATTVISVMMMHKPKEKLDIYKLIEEDSKRL
jgi:hypothetical protein